MLQAFSDELSYNFKTFITPSTCPEGNADGLRFSSYVEDEKRILAVTLDTAAGEKGILGKVLMMFCYELAEPLNLIFYHLLLSLLFRQQGKVPLFSRFTREKETNLS